MATVKDSVPHVERTAQDPRQPGLHEARVSRIELVNQNMRLFRLNLTEGPVRHLPGQYVDLHVPDIETVGGFTITSPPQTALLPQQSQASDKQQQPQATGPYLELAVQRSPNNPPAAYLYQDPPEILDAPVAVRIGGSFTYPPLNLSRKEFEAIKNVIFIAGGVGINPIMSMVSAMDLAGHGRLGGMAKRVRVLYTSRRTHEAGEKDEKQPEEVLFDQRLRWIADRWKSHAEVDFEYNFFETNRDHGLSSGQEASKVGNVVVEHRRMTHDDVFRAIGPVETRKHTLVYVCGLPSMTDEYVELLKNSDGLDEKRVLCEKWW